jgi:hypothetical protein
MTGSLLTFRSKDSFNQAFFIHLLNFTQVSFFGHVPERR